MLLSGKTGRRAKPPSNPRRGKEGFHPAMRYVSGQRASTVVGLAALVPRPFASVTGCSHVSKNRNLGEIRQQNQRRPAQVTEWQKIVARNDRLVLEAIASIGRSRCICLRRGRRATTPARSGRICRGTTAALCVPVEAIRRCRRSDIVVRASCRQNHIAQGSWLPAAPPGRAGARAESQFVARDEPNETPCPAIGHCRAGPLWIRPAGLQHPEAPPVAGGNTAQAATLP
jgi:hypothetical protein